MAATVHFRLHDGRHALPGHAAAMLPDGRTAVCVNRDLSAYLYDCGQRRWLPAASAPCRVLAGHGSRPPEHLPGDGAAVWFPSTAADADAAAGADHCYVDGLVYNACADRWFSWGQYAALRQPLVIWTLAGDAIEIEGWADAVVAAAEAAWRMPAASPEVEAAERAGRNAALLDGFTLEKTGCVRCQWCGQDAKRCVVAGICRRFGGRLQRTHVGLVSDHLMKETTWQRRPGSWMSNMIMPPPRKRDRLPPVDERHPYGCYNSLVDTRLEVQRRERCCVRPVVDALDQTWPTWRQADPGFRYYYGLDDLPPVAAGEGAPPGTDGAPATAPALAPPTDHGFVRRVLEQHPDLADHEEELSILFDSDQGPTSALDAETCWRLLAGELSWNDIMLVFNDPVGDCEMLVGMGAGAPAPTPAPAPAPRTEPAAAGSPPPGAAAALPEPREWPRHGFPFCQRDDPTAGLPAWKDPLSSEEEAARLLPPPRVKVDTGLRRAVRKAYLLRPPAPAPPQQPKPVLPPICSSGFRRASAAAVAV